VQRAANGEFVRFDIEVTSAQGRHSTVDFSLTPVPGPDGQVDLIVPEGRDITEHHRAAREADVARAALSAVLENVQDAIVACDEHGRLTVFNRSSRDIHGVRDVTVHPGEWAQHFDLYEADGTTLLPTGRVPLVRAWNGEHLQNVEMVIAPHGQARRVLLASGGPLTAPDGTRMGAVIAMHDITERRNVENRLRHDAMHDRLTGLPNRTYLRHLLELAMERYRRRPDAPYAVIFLDLDGFKHINDAYGHLMGDRVLLEVAARLRTAVRKSDTVARLGGDEFAVLLDAPCDEMNVMSVVRRVQAAMALPINLQGHQTPVTASIGATVATPAYRELDDPLRDADTAMYRAKRSGRNCSALFDQSMHDAVMQRVTLERELRRAIPAGELRLHYQPIVHLGTGTCTGFEALVRWQHPERGLLYPGHFMEVATSTGLVAPLGTWVIHETARQLAAWRAVPGLERLTVSVNLDDQQVQQSTRPEDQVLLFDLPEGLELEVTESSLFDTAEAVHALHTLASRGVPLSLDDFGTGYASLAAVQRHPISTLKIDRSFVAPLPGGNRQRAIVAGVITMAGHLGLRVVAEGLETQEQVQAVQDLGCTHGQGYLYSRPVPPEQALQYALTHQSPAPCP